MQPDVIRIKGLLNREMKSRHETNLDDVLRTEIERSILFYANALGYSFAHTSKSVA
jgi:hypothetical protein